MYPINDGPGRPGASSGLFFISMHVSSVSPFSPTTTRAFSTPTPGALSRIAAARARAGLPPNVVVAERNYFTDLHLICLLLCRMVNISLQYGTSGDSAQACGFLGLTLGSMFHREREGYRFAKLG